MDSQTPTRAGDESQKRILKRVMKHPQNTSGSSSSPLKSSASNCKKCYCGEKAVLQTSKTPYNPNRRFYGCPNWNSPTKCSYFVWIDNDEPADPCEQCQGSFDTLKEDMAIMMEEVLRLRDETTMLKEKELQLSLQVTDLHARLDMEINKQSHPSINKGWCLGFFCGALCVVLIIILLIGICISVN